MKTFNILRRDKQLVNTDPQRRCYNGCYYSYDYVLGGWYILEHGINENQVQERLGWWKDLNQCAVDDRGEDARCELMIEEVK